MNTSRRHIVYIIFLVTIAVIAGATGGVFLAITHDLPQIRSLENFQPAAATRIYSADKVLLAEIFTQRRKPVSLRAIPEYLKQAIIATEDRKFYEHVGVDFRGVARAIIRDISAGEYVQGASTITQQLARTLFLTPHKSIMRKLKEAFLAFQIERRYTKDEILKLYLNQIYFGSGAYGVEAAARIFFGKSVSDLTLPECALIAGMPKSPSRFSPLVDQERALKRRAVVLEQMARNGIITAEQMHAAKKTPLRLAKRANVSIRAPYFVEYVKNFLEKTIGEKRLYRTGLTVYTTLNYKMQKAAEKAVADGLKQLSARMERRGLLEKGHPEAALVCLDASQGAIRAMVGGSDFEQSKFNRATMARRQPGSAFKPVVYALAIEKGAEQNDLLWDAPVVFRGARKGEDWSPENFSGGFKGEMTLRSALALSENVPAVRLLNKLGPMPAVEFAHRMGITSPLRGNLSLVLGTSEVNLLELTSAYAIFPNGGVWNKPFGVLEVLDRDGRCIWKVRPQRRTVITRQSAAIMTDMLKAVVMEGTGRAAKRIGRPLAGKTGTTDGYKDALFIGFSPTIVAGVWVGTDNHTTLGDKETGAKAALPIWINFMEQVLMGRPCRYFDLPEGVIKMRIDPETGFPVSQGCPKGVAAVFRKCNKPRNYSATRAHGPKEEIELSSLRSQLE